ncbi:hypothetical protein VT50_0210095 [Streptomyces antioxidans]|uniref:Uncharacterized protein n=1 Tax=Streptomyces antioxidans TaxID=1507734 RepID=A0A1V4D8F6_9ACTN|nr:hypothetical protein VT50_0210095 [Streptomyces antioxidans]
MARVDLVLLHQFRSWVKLFHEKLGGRADTRPLPISMAAALGRLQPRVTQGWRRPPHRSTVAVTIEMETIALAAARRRASCFRHVVGRQHPRSARGQGYVESQACRDMRGVAQRGVGEPLGDTDTPPMPFDQSVGANGVCYLARRQLSATGIADQLCPDLESIPVDGVQFPLSEVCPWRGQAFSKRVATKAPRARMGVMV